MSSYKFSGHQTFVFRHGWLEKGVGLIRKNPRGFLEDDAIVKLGVGKNMVESIKYWCSQTGLLEDGAEFGTMQLTPFAEFIFGNGQTAGVDPFLEDDATLWLLHYNLVVHAPVSTWNLVFNAWNKPEFTKGEILQFIQRRLEGIAAISAKTLERDIDCFVRSYTGTRGKTGEENFDCPFLALALIQATGDSDLFRLSICRKRSLPSEIIGYAIIHKLAEMNSTTSSMYNMLFEPHSPGQVFKLDENTLVDAVMELDHVTQGAINMTDSAGLTGINFAGTKEDKIKAAQDLLDAYYGVKKYWKTLSELIGGSYDPSTWSMTAAHLRVSPVTS
jgi:hypothetical protein